MFKFGACKTEHQDCPEQCPKAGEQHQKTEREEVSYHCHRPDIAGMNRQGQVDASSCQICLKGGSLPACEGLHYRGVSSLMRSLTPLVMVMAAEKLNRLIATNTPMPRVGEKAV